MEMDYKTLSPLRRTDSTLSYDQFLAQWKIQTRTFRADMMTDIRDETIMKWVKDQDVDEIGMSMMLDCMEKIYGKPHAKRVNTNSHKHFKTVVNEEMTWNNQPKETTMFDGNYVYLSARTVQQNPDGIFAVKIDNKDEIIIGYECDGDDKRSKLHRVANKMWQYRDLSASFVEGAQKRITFTVRSNFFKAADNREKADIKNYPLFVIDNNTTMLKFYQGP